MADPIYCVLDFETGGLNENRNGLASVGIIRLDTDLNEVDKTYALIYEPDKIYESGALLVNGFTIEQLKSEGMSIEDAIKMLHEQCDGMVIVNHNSAFDCKWLNRLGFNIQESVDTVALAQKTWPMLKSKLGIVASRIGLEVKDAHNALGDVLMTVDVLRYFAKQNPENLKPEKIDWNRFKR
jgi:DNA polymerase III alpha subunit (gram-positive type)